ncbi:HEAT repeat domain-containing protein [Lentisphaera profundi]|uniref:HEAT repeat domain-containing protein n=1 Tax=Lentisphaera profundi TaxID=1658616 RepID=A0ABY7VSA6_9BACT|nr:HEAT repeat domain-containing protein [Lentisphaera profundi]WDE95772.1 HEAT repeat domain-containing protein [Lentisphaera profundi]
MIKRFSFMVAQINLVIVLSLCISFEMRAIANETTHSADDYEKKAALKIKNFEIPKGFKARLWADESQVKNPSAITFDSHGRLFVAEIDRWQHGVDDIRERPYMLKDDFLIQTNADRLKMYQKHASKIPMSHYTAEEDKIRLVEDSDGDGRADRSRYFANGFNDVLDGIGIGIIERDGKIYYANIPNLWVLEDLNGDGVSDKRNSLQDGFGVRMSFSGHDMHGLVWGPDGKLYWSIGDRGYNFTTKEGKEFHSPHEGAVFRCDADGSDIEVFYRGLRNPQELQFDNYGNLFTADNDSDNGDLERINYLLEGGDSGWHAGHQALLSFGNKLAYRSSIYGDRKKLLSAWMVEDMWKTRNINQPAFMLPAIGQINGGPSGFLFNPGNSFGKLFNNKFFVNIFMGSSLSTHLRSFDILEQGAGFKTTNDKLFFGGSNCVDMEFGPDGKMYISEYNHGGFFNQDVGSIYTLELSEEMNKAEILEDKKILTSSFADKTDEQVYELLARDHQRIRMRAQFELAKRNESGKALFSRAVKDLSAPQLQRIHGVWGLGMMAKDNDKCLEILVEIMLNDEDDQVRIQCARVLGDHKYVGAVQALIQALGDAHERVVMYAGIALGRLAHEGAVPALIEALEKNDGKDLFLQHGLVMGLAGTENMALLTKYMNDDSKAVRMGVLLSLRKRQSPKLVQFLSDENKEIKFEAIRAINDLVIPNAQEKLALILNDLEAPKNEPEKFIHYRVINANYYLGDKRAAQRLLKYASRDDLSNELRQEALIAIEAWNDHVDFDNTTGLPRQLLAVREDIKEQVKNSLEALFKKGDLLAQLNRIAVKYNFHLSSKIIESQVIDNDLKDQVRLGALAILLKRKTLNINELIIDLLDDHNPAMRLAAQKAMYSLKIPSAYEQSIRIFKSGSTKERQLAYELIGNKAPIKIQKLLFTEMSKISAGGGDRECMLEILEASKKQTSQNFIQVIRQYEKSLDAEKGVGKYESLQRGGEIDRGRDVFFNHGSAQCIRCHKVNGFGSEVGPDLSLIGKQRTRAYILQGIVDPGAVVAPGYGVMVIKTKEEGDISGVFMGHTKDGVKLKMADGKLQTYKNVNIIKHQDPISGMPPMKYLLKAHEIRDLVEYLCSLKTLRKKDAAPKKSSH